MDDIYEHWRLKVALRLGWLPLLWAPAIALPATATSTFNTTATVVATCAISATNVAFGSYSTAQLDATGSISITCTNGTTYTVALDAGVGASATLAARKMTGPSSQTLTYSLYQDVSRSTLWGDTAGVNTAAGTGSGAAQSLTVYGRIPSLQFPGAGTYSDTITVTLSY